MNEYYIKLVLVSEEILAVSGGERWIMKEISWGSINQSKSSMWIERGRRWPKGRLRKEWMGANIVTAPHPGGELQ